MCVREERVIGEAGCAFAPVTACALCFFFTSHSISTLYAPERQRQRREWEGSRGSSLRRDRGCAPTE